EDLWENLHLVFATASGSVRRNRLSDFRNIRSSGLIAMKLDDEDRLIGVATCREGQDVFLGTRNARCIRFQITDDTLRVFAGRGSSGVRVIKLAEGDSVNSLCVLNHVEATVEERAAYLRMANARRRAEAAQEGEEAEETVVTDDAEIVADDLPLSPERFAELEAAEEVLLIVSNAGFGRRSSAYDYRVSGRGGQGINNMTFSANKRGNAVVATLPVLEGTDVMLVTDAGRLIRLPIGQVRIMSRQASGVTLFRLNDTEEVTSVFPVMDEDDDGEEAEIADTEADTPATDAGQDD
ncbi:MAG: DNA gyrase C-terminal beta-propeller domain-containing protein, partial [Komagataeibacter saccharivorans]|uniref:DNA gyrase C-terminal beta-propeller domain-containing protein n=1 Tax=Komagataeibacter saccharivorans TaxID=265959 RepID=UPI0039E7853C